MLGPFTESRKITLNGVVPIDNGTRAFGVYNGSYSDIHRLEQIMASQIFKEFFPDSQVSGNHSNGNNENNETYELTFEYLRFPNLKRATIALNRNGVELWKVKLAGTDMPESLQIFYNGTVYEANWKLERSSKNLKFRLELTNDHRFLEFAFDNYGQSGKFNLKSNFIVEVVEAVSRKLGIPLLI